MSETQRQIEWLMSETLLTDHRKFRPDQLESFVCYFEGDKRAVFAAEQIRKAVATGRISQLNRRRLLMDTVN